MKTLVNIVIILLGLAFIAAGFYVGIWVMFIGGIVQIIEGAKMDPVSASYIAIGLAKIIFFEIPIVFGWIIGVTVFSGVKGNSIEVSLR